MKTLCKNGISAYLIDDNDIVMVDNEQVRVSGSRTFNVADMNSGNTTVHNDVTPPADWSGGRYAYDGANWIKNLSAEVPEFVTIRQARLALNESGLLDQVNTAVAAADSSTQIEWEYTSTVTRKSPIVDAIATGLGFTTEQLDDLFRNAATF